MSQRAAGFAIVSALLMVVVVAVVLCAFIASVASERAASQAIYQATRSRMAAEAAMEEGLARLKHLFETYPDSATAWEPLADTTGTRATEATLFHYRDAATGELHCIPLFSGAEARPVAQKQAPWQLVDATAPFADEANSVDLNPARYPGDAGGRLGSPVGGLAARRVPWVEMADPQDPTRILSRYAFWVEDESFRANVNTAGRAPAGDAAAAVRPGGVEVAALLPLLDPALSGTSSAAALERLRAAAPGGRLLSLSALGPLSATAAERARFGLSLYSGGASLSRSGARRLNVNAVVSDTSDATAQRQQIDRLLAPVLQQLPHFGQRFYRLNPAEPNTEQVSATHAGTYLLKLAANLRDAIDTDSLPTIINADGSIRTGRPETAIEPLPGALWPGAAWAPQKGGENSVAAVGKEAVPYFQEFGVRARVYLFDPKKADTKSQAHYRFTLDYYFEFWNLADKPISAGPNAFLRVYNQAGFDTGYAGGIPAGRPFEIPLPAGLVFPAGSVTVLTTDPTPSAKLITPEARVVILPIELEKRYYEGYTRNKTTKDLFRVNLLSRSTRKYMDSVVIYETDYETAMVLGNDQGYLEGLCTLPIARADSASNNALSIQDDNDAIKKPDAYFFRGGSIAGTWPGAQVGDPRSNNEQLFMRIYDTSGDKDQTRYYNSSLGDNQVPGVSDFGRPNITYTFPGSWSDASPWRTDGVNAPMTIPDGPLHSIGELGHLYDPVRGLGESGNIAYSRGGGRTLRIGQPDPLWDGSETSASREWAAWRLADVYATDDALFVEGLINPNGIRRDGGAALRTALHGFTHAPAGQPGSDPGLAGVALDEAALTTIITGIETWLANRETPFYERGQLSEALAPPSGAAYDRGREALFRSLAERITTRGSVFTLYAVGQSIRQTPDGRKLPLATALLRVTFRLEPVWEPALAESFDPANAEEVAARFRKPERWRVAVLQVVR